MGADQDGLSHRAVPKVTALGSGRALTNIIMGTPGTRNAAIIWRVIDSSGEPLSEAQVKEATGLGTGTVNRLCRTLATAGMLQRIEPSSGGVVRYASSGSIEQVRMKFCPPGPEKPEAPRPVVAFGAGLPRVSSVWQLGAMQ